MEAALLRPTARGRGRSSACCACICCGDSSNGKYRQRSPAAAGRVDEVRRQARLAGAGGAGDQDRCCRGRYPSPPSISSRPSTPGGDPLDAGPRAGGRSEVIGSTEMPSRADQERVLVGPVARAAILDDPQPPRRDLLVDAVVEQDHAVGDVLFEPVPGEGALAALAGDDRGHAAVLQPAEQARAAPTRRIAGVRRAREQRLDGVEDDALGADRLDRVTQADEEPFQVVLAGFFDLAAARCARSRSTSFFWRDAARSRSKPSERDVLRSSLVRVLLEGHEDAGLAELRRRRGRGTRWRGASCRNPARRRRASAALGAARRR